MWTAVGVTTAGRPAYAMSRVSNFFREQPVNQAKKGFAVVDRGLQDFNNVQALQGYRCIDGKTSSQNTHG